MNLRKLAVGLVALSVLAGCFFLYLRLDRTPPIVVDAAKPTPTPVAEVNDANSQESVGKISGIGIGAVQKTNFLHRNEFGLIDRKFGFEQLVHKQGNQWQITKPYMWIYLDRFVCRVTADLGNARLVEAFGGAMPTDAEFTGNVVIHVAPTDSRDPWECFILLDDVSYLAEKSLFSSAGAVRFLSRAMRLTGTGMELIYDGPRSQLELFRVFDLDSLRLRSSEIKALADKKNKDSSQRGEEGSAAAEDSHAAAQSPTVADSNAPAAEVYQCVFRRNVRLDSPEMMAVARDVLSINNIQWARPDGSDSKGKLAADPNETKVGRLSASKALNTTASSYPVMNAIPDELYDIVVTCDGGADITLLGAPGLVNASTIPMPETSSAPAVPDPNEIDSTSNRQHVVAQRVDFDFLTNDSAMSGPVAMRLLVDSNSIAGASGDTLMPLDVTALGAIRYAATSKQIVLEGGSTATLLRTEPNSTDKYRLAAPRLTLDLAVDSQAGDAVKVDLRKFVADSGPETPAAIDSSGVPPVTVRTWHWVADELVGWGALDAYELQYDVELGESSAVGPGLVWLYNATTIRSKDDPNTTVEPFYACLSRWDKLDYWSSTNRIVAEDDSQQLVLDYFPLVDGEYGPQTRVVAGHVEAMLRQIAEGRMDLASLVASQGIEYDSEIDNLHFIGSQMVYDQAQSVVTIDGDDQRPCYLNGVLVDAISVDLKTRRVEETKIAGPSFFQIPR